MALKAIDDVFFTWEGTELRYRIRIEGLNEIIYEGKAFAKPNSNTVKINVSRIIRNYLENDLPCIADPEDDYSYVCNEAYKNFLIDVYDPRTDSWSEEDGFDFLWYYDNTNGIPYKLSDPVNGHSAIGVKNLLTTWDVSNGVETSVKTSYDLVGCEIKDSGEDTGNTDFRNYLQMDITSPGYINWKASSSGFNTTIQYRKNYGTWQTITSTTGGTQIMVSSGDNLQFRGNNTTYFMGLDEGESGNHIFTTFFDSSAGFNLSGNIMSLFNPTSFESMNTFPSTTTSIEYMFWRCVGLKDASRLILPVTTLTDACYLHMFYGCSNLTKAPQLPATTLAPYCYEGMFHECTSLKQAPELPATTLADYCYNSMFHDCSSLITAPSIIPATTLANGCCNSMFYRCSSLITAPQLPATTLAGGCYSGMFAGCSSLRTAPQLPATTLAGSCYSAMFEECASLITAPALPATTLATFCYQYMFEGCTSLVQAPSILPATILPDNGRCYREMFAGCTSLTQAPALPATTLTPYCYYSMFSGCSNLNYIKCLATDISEFYCTRNWVVGVADTGTFVKDSNMTGWTTDSVNGIPLGWTIINDDGSQSGSTSGDSTEYLTIEFISGGSFNFKCFYEDNSRTIRYKRNNGNWETISSTLGSVATITGTTGDKIYLKGNNDSYNNVRFYSEDTTTKLKVYNNIMSLIYGDDFVDKTSFVKRYVLYHLFHGLNVVDASGLILPASILIEGCYWGMFYNCRFLTQAPKLPATTLAISCYNEMFYGCQRLTYLPNRMLPATTLASYCYYHMFYGCENITIAPELPATTLADRCYSGMFIGCYGLTVAPALPATTLAVECYADMFSDCERLTVVPELPATTLADGCYAHMFQRCRFLTLPPILPATTLSQGCYQGMFAGCTDLTTVPELPATTLAVDCYNSMFQYCGLLTTAPELPAPILVKSCYQNMFTNCTSLTYIKCLATDISATDCTKDWVKVNGSVPVISTEGTFVKASSMNNWLRGANGIPYKWNISNDDDSESGSTPTVISGTVNGYVVCYCGEYALYYQNRRGGWDTFLFEGTCKKIDDYGIYKYTKNYDNTKVEFGSTRYLNAITERWELNSGWLREYESRRFAHHLLSTNQAYLHILAEDRIIPVVITDSQAEYKTYATNDYKPINYRITVENSQKKYRR